MSQARRSHCLACRAASCRYSLNCVPCARQRPGRPSPGLPISWLRTASCAPANSPVQTPQTLKGGQSPRRPMSKSCTSCSEPRRLPRAEARPRVGFRCAPPFPPCRACCAGAPVAVGSAVGGRAPARSRSPARPAAPCAPGSPGPPQARVIGPARLRMPARRGPRGARSLRPRPAGRAGRAANNARAPGGARRGRRAPPQSGRRGPLAGGGTRPRYAATMRTVASQREKRPQMLGGLLRQDVEIPVHAAPACQRGPGRLERPLSLRGDVRKLLQLR